QVLSGRPLDAFLENAMIEAIRASGAPRFPAVLSLALLGALAVLSVPAAAAPSTVAGIPVPESMTVRGIPPVSPEIAAALQPYEGIRGAALFDWAPSGRRVLIGTRFADTVQLHEVAQPLGARTQLTFLKERVSMGAYRPGAPDQIVFA